MFKTQKGRTVGYNSITWKRLKSNDGSLPCTTGVDALNKNHGSFKNMNLIAVYKADWTGKRRKYGETSLPVIQE